MHQTLEDKLFTSLYLGFVRRNIQQMMKLNLRTFNNKNEYVCVFQVLGDFWEGYKLIDGSWIVCQ